MPGTQNLVGLNDDGERLSYFGVTNPNPAAATYRVRFFDATGKPVGEQGRMPGAIPVWGLATAVARPDGGFEIVH